MNSGALTEEQNSSTNALALAAQSAKQSALAMDGLDSLASLDTQFLLTPFNMGAEINTTEYISAKILTLSLLGEDTSELIEKLLSMQHKDGGFAQSLPYSSTVLDTALALESLSTIHTKETEITKAIDYLLTQQNSDGSWKTTQEDKIYTTAIVLRALWLHRKAYSVQTVMDEAKTYLLVQQNTNGSYGTETFETALVLRSIAPLEYDKANLQTTIDYLDTLQQVSGSWEEDIYTTALVLQSLLLADKEVPNPDLASLRGLVVDEDTGIALSDIEVHLLSDENRTLTTSSDGKFFFEGLRNGSYTLYIADSNYAPLQTTLNFSGNDIDLGTLRLNKNVNATVSTLTGVIKDKQTGEPIVNAQVNLNEFIIISDSLGRYEFKDINASNYTLRVNKIGYYRLDKSLSIQSNIHYSLNVLLESVTLPIDTNSTEGNTTLPLEPLIFGNIYDSETNNSLPLALIVAKINGTSISEISDLNGSYKLDIGSFGDVDIEIHKEGYISKIFTINISDHALNLDIALEPFNKDNPDNNSSIEGVVIDSISNEPMSDVVVHIVGKYLDEVINTDSNGSFMLENINSYDLNISFDAEGYQSTKRYIALQKNQYMDLAQIRMRPLDPKSFLPDLIVEDINISMIDINASGLKLQGSIEVDITNAGAISTETGFTVLCFYDVNKDGNYTASIDLLLGEKSIDTLLEQNQHTRQSILLSGELPFVNAPISIWIDSRTEVIEKDEVNNIVSTNTLCHVSQNIDFIPQLKWSWNGENTQHPTSNRISYNPYIAQFNDDNNDSVIDENDIPDVVFFGNNGGWSSSVLQVISGKDGSNIIEKEIIQDNQKLYLYQMAIGDIDNDGIVEIIVFVLKQGYVDSTTYSLRVYEHDGTLKWKVNIPRFARKISLADINNDGNIEIIFGRMIFNNQGVMIKELPSYINLAWSQLVYNLDHDDQLEFIISGTVYDTDGSKLFSMNSHGNGLGIGSYAVSDFDKDGEQDIISMLYDGYASFYLARYSNTGQLIWEQKLSRGSVMQGMSPTIANFDDDIEPEIAVIPNEKDLLVYESDGTLKWEKRIFSDDTYPSVRNAPVAVDIDMDGKYELLIKSHEYLFILDGENGNELGRIAFPKYNLVSVHQRTSFSVADVDKDGRLDIIIPYYSNSNTCYDSEGFCPNNGIKVFSNPTWAGARGIWNQENYHIDNINDDGTIPRVQKKSWLTHNTFGA